MRLWRTRNDENIGYVGSCFHIFPLGVIRSIFPWSLRARIGV